MNELALCVIIKLKLRNMTVLNECPLYDDLRNKLYEYINSVDENFNMFTNHEKLSFVLGCQNVINIINVIYKCVKTCKSILDRRRRFLYR